jgi:homoserine kinase
VSEALRPARIRVPCSTSNLGAGYDTLGLALDRYLDVVYEPAGHHSLVVERHGTLAGLDVSGVPDLVARTFTGVLARQGITPSGRLTLTSAIPVGRGLGSSAAAVLAGYDLSLAARGQPCAAEEAFEAAFAHEGHGDNAAPCLYGGLRAVVRAAGGPHVIRLELADTIGFAYAAPATAVSTEAARRALPRRVAHEVAAASLGRLTALVRGLAEGDPGLLRMGMDDELHVPYRVGMIPGAREAMSAAYDAAAWAVTISGAGSGLIAMCDKHDAARVAAAMHHAFDAGNADPECVGFAVHPDFEGLRRVEA